MSSLLPKTQKHMIGTPIKSEIVHKHCEHTEELLNFSKIVADLKACTRVCWSCKWRHVINPELPKKHGRVSTDNGVVFFFKTHSLQENATCDCTIQNWQNCNQVSCMTGGCPNSTPETLASLTRGNRFKSLTVKIGLSRHHPPKHHPNQLLHLASQAPLSPSRGSL